MPSLSSRQYQVTRKEVSYILYHAWDKLLKPNLMNKQVIMPCLTNFNTNDQRIMCFPHHNSTWLHNHAPPNLGWILLNARTHQHFSHSSWSSCKVRIKYLMYHACVVYLNNHSFTLVTHKQTYTYILAKFKKKRKEVRVLTMQVFINFGLVRERRDPFGRSWSSFIHLLPFKSSHVSSPPL